MKQHAKNAETEKRSVSGNDELFAKADQRMAQLSITNFSEYVRSLIRRDVAGELKVARADEAHKQAA